MLIGAGYEDQFLPEEALTSLMEETLAQVDLAGKRVLIIIPDGTRTAPIPQMFRLFCRHLAPQAAQLDFIVALGTHPPMSEAAINRLVGVTPAERSNQYAHINIFNHRWDLPDTFITLGEIPAGEMMALTGGRINHAVPVRINKIIQDYDQLIICGPTYPHEIVGFSGGNKYFFPGIGGEEVINVSHWLGAMITNYQIIGTVDTPVRRVIDRAASFINKPKLCFCMAVRSAGNTPRLSGLYIGAPEEAFVAASALSARLNITWVEKPFHRVLAVMPMLYEDIWTASKGMYKLEPAVADGGELIIYAPHIDEISYTHGHQLDQIGYHVLEYFTKQWKRFKAIPGSVLTHSTLLKGLGRYDAETGVESTRIQVTLATGVPEARCRRLNLGYMDPASIDPKAWRGREEEGILFVPKAGEILYRLT